VTSPLSCPGPDFASKSLPIHTVPAGSKLPRFHDVNYGPLYFNRTTDFRWNSPNGSFGVCYVGLSDEASFAETFLRDPGRSYIDLDLVASRAMSRLSAVRELRLVEMANNGLYQVGVSSLVCSITPYDLPHAWAAAIHGHPDKPDGILYRSSHDDSAYCAGLFDRAEDALLDDKKPETDLIGQDWFWDLIGRYNLTIPPS
jgi:RES domain.